MSFSIDQFISKISVGLAVNFVSEQLIINSFKKMGIESIKVLSSDELKEEKNDQDTLFDIMIFDVTFIEEKLGGFSACGNGKTFDINWPDIDKKLPFIFLLGNEKIPKIFLPDGRNVGMMRISNNDIANLSSYVEMFALKHYEVKSLIQKLEQSHKDLQQTQAELVERLARAIEARDQTTGSHVRRMQDYAKTLAEKSGKVDAKDFNLLTQATALHDIGKIAIKDCILTKPGKFTDPERAIMATHAEEGAKILEPRSGNMPLLNKSSIVARSHHEKWDGTGYPEKLKGTEIDLWARIVAIVDVFDALVSPRPYKRGWDFDQAMDEIKKGGKSGQFDPDLVNCFVANKEDIRTIYNRFMTEESHE